MVSLRVRSPQLPTTKPPRAGFRHRRNTIKQRHLGGFSSELMDVRPPPNAATGNRPWHHFLQCPFNDHLCRTLKEYALDEVLIEVISVTGCSSMSQQRATVQTRKVLRRGFRAVLKCHKAGFSISGNYSSSNFLVDNQLFVKLHDVDLIEFNTEEGEKDYYQFIRLTMHEVFARQGAPPEVVRWLKLISKGKKGYDYVISYHSSMMEHHQAVTTHMSLYVFFLELKHTNPRLYGLVVSWMPQYDRWKNRKRRCVNSLMEKTRRFKDPSSGKHGKKQILPHPQCDVQGGQREAPLG